MQNDTEFNLVYDDSSISKLDSELDILDEVNVAIFFDWILKVAVLDDY